MKSAKRKGTAKRRNPQMIALESVRWRLALLWFVGSVSLFFILAAQSLGGVYQERLQGVWGWALPNFIPTLSLMISVFAASALRPWSDDDDLNVRTAFYRLALALSLFYIGMLLLTILSQPFLRAMRGDPNFNAASILETSNLWLAPLQGLVVASLGVLFFLKQEQQPETDSVTEAETLTG